MISHNLRIKQLTNLFCKPGVYVKLTKRKISKLFPGILLAITIGGAASHLSEHYTTPVMLLALLIGMAFNFLSEDRKCSKGVEFASKDLLRIGIICLGARITLGDISALGVWSFMVVLSLMAMTMASGFVVSPLINKGWRFALMTGGAVAICGVSAALAIVSVIPHNNKTEQNTLFTVIAVTTLSTIAMVLYPILFSVMGLSEQESGFLIGATIHDVAQVIGAGYSISTDAGDTATIVKLLRVSMLPVILLIIIYSLPNSAKKKNEAKIPFFVVGFLMVVILNSFNFIPETAVNLMTEISKWFLVIAISALGVKTSLQKMLCLGYGHFALVLSETLILLGLAILAVKFILNF